MGDLVTRVATQDVPTLTQRLSQDGFALVSDVLAPCEVDDIARKLAESITAHEKTSGTIRSKRGSVYAARNLLDVFPDAVHLWRRAPLVQLLTTVLGEDFGLVRGLYFDKHPSRPWSLPWHKDLTIAVQRNDLRSPVFRNPTTKAGVAHVEAPSKLLHQMLTLRIHFDDVTETNGPLKVIVGSHASKETVDVAAGEIVSVIARRGDVLAMRPLLSHSSGNPTPGTKQHRRIIHLEFAATPTLPDGYRWRYFHPWSTEG